MPQIRQVSCLRRRPPAGVAPARGLSALRRADMWGRVTVVSSMYVARRLSKFSGNESYLKEPRRHTKPVDGTREERLDHCARREEQVTDALIIERAHLATASGERR